MTLEKAVEILNINVLLSPKATEFKEAVEVVKSALRQKKTEIEELTEKHHNECRQIAEYDDDLNAVKYIANDLLIRLFSHSDSDTDSMVNEHDRLLKDLRTASVTFIPEADSKEAVKKFAEALKAEMKNLSKVHLFGREFALVGDTFVDSFMEKYEKGE